MTARRRVRGSAPAVSAAACSGDGGCQQRLQECPVRQFPGKHELDRVLDRPARQNPFALVSDVTVGVAARRLGRDCVRRPPELPSCEPRPRPASWTDEHRLSPVDGTAGCGPTSARCNGGDSIRRARQTACQHGRDGAGTTGTRSSCVTRRTVTRKRRRSTASSGGATGGKTSAARRTR